MPQFKTFQPDYTPMADRLLTSLLLSVEALLGHRYVDTTLNYARLYDETVAKQVLKARAPGRSCSAS
jgi:integrase